MPRESRNPHAKTIAAIKRARTRRLAALVTRAYYLHRRKQDEKMYNLICEEFVSLGGVYVKFLQGVLLRSEVMRRWHNPEKLKIFENLDSEPINIGALLQHELPKDKLAQIAMVQPVPFAAGSFGQVYYAQLRTGQPVIIKVLRPMVRELLKHDLKLLGTFSKAFFVKLYKNMNLQLTDALKEFSAATLRETDYKHEAEFADELYEAYKNHPKIVIPKTYLDLCTDNIIVQDYVDGISVAQVVRLHEQGVNPVDYVKEQLGSDIVTQLEMLGYESLVAVFRLPRVQGDPHPGNIRLMTDNRVGLIDFGISARAPADKSGLFGLLESYDKVFKGSQTAIGLFEHSLRFFVSDLYRALRRLGDFIGRNNDRDYVNEVSQVAGSVFEKATGTTIINMDFKQDASILTIINKLVNKGNRFGLVMKLEATEILRAIQTYTSLVGSLGLYGEVMPKIMKRAVEDIRAEHPDIALETKDAVSIGDALETVANWLERVADRDPLLFKELSGKIRVNTAVVPEPKKEEETKDA
jgi:hypothetical protein